MRKLEWGIYVAISLAISYFFYFKEIQFGDFKNLDNILLGTITLDSIGTGFLVAAIAMIPSLTSNSFFQKLKELKTDVKLLKLMAIEIRVLLLSAILALVLLFAQNQIFYWKYNYFILYVWIFVLTLSLILINSVVRIFLEALKDIQDKS